MLSKGVHGSNPRLALLTDGEFFGETDLVTDTCGMGMLLARMPWNQISCADKSPASAQI